MISILALFVFGWFFFKSVGLAFRVAWCAAKAVAAVLFVVALPLMVVGLLIGGIIKLALPLLLIAAAFYLFKSCALPHKKHCCTSFTGIYSGVFSYTLIKAQSTTGIFSPNSSGRNRGQTFSAVQMTEAANRLPISQASGSVLP